MRLRVLAAAAIAAGLVMIGAPRSARAQIDSREGIALQNQILELRHELQQQQYGGGGSSLGGAARPAPPPGGGADELSPQLLERVQQLEDAVRQLRGRVDEIGNQVQRQSDDQTKQIGDLNFRLQTLENGGAAGSPPPRPGQTLSPPPGTLGTIAAPPVATNAPTQAGAAPPVLRRTPELALQEGNAALARRDYPAAEAAAREVLGSGRASPRAYDAQFVLAQALAGKRDWPQAAIAYDDAYGRSHTGSHAPDALLGLANALVAIGEKKAACETAQKLRAEFPTTRADLREPLAGVRLRAGCH